MTIDELKAAYAAGARIQIRLQSVVHNFKWWDLSDPSFDGLAKDYRIKPTEDDLNEQP